MIPKCDDKFPKEKSATVELVRKSSMSDLSSYRVYSQLQVKRRPRINYKMSGGDGYNKYFQIPVQHGNENIDDREGSDPTQKN